MQYDTALNLITTTFNQPLDETLFVNFASNLLNDISTEHAFVSQHGASIPQPFQGHIRQYRRPFVYYDPNGERLDVLVVRLSKASSLELARTMQRNFAAWYLKQVHSESVEAALIAFYHDDVPDWRFSFVHLEYEFGDEGVKEKLTPARRYSFLVGPHEPTHTAEQQLLPFLQRDDRNPTIAEIGAAFQVQVVSKQFFESYKELFLQLLEALEEVVKADAQLQRDFKRAEIDLPNFAKKLLGQIVFLYFVQKKGWMGVSAGESWGMGPRDFLRRLFDRQDGVVYDNFFNDVLEPLFYRALAVQRTADLFTIGGFTCQIPFLNGGLFEPMGNYDWQNTRLLLPNSLFSNRRDERDERGSGILDIFDRYNFTVWEEEPLEKEVAVDPEMLGKVFENLLEVQDRKSKGAFYTPREIVHYMCQESLINYLHTQIGSISEIEPISNAPTREDIAVLVRKGALALQQDAAKEAGLQKGEHVLPPAVRGCAAELDEALATIKLCDPAIGSGAFPVGMLHEIVQARQALDTQLKRQPTAYDLKRHAIQESIYGVDIDAGAVEIAKLRLWLSLVVDEENYDDIQPLPNLDYKIVRGNSLLGVEKNLFNSYLFVKLDELKRRYFAETHRLEKARLKAQIDLLIGQLTGAQAVFDFEVYFHEVFAGLGGFDVVIGNPPYIKEYTARSAFDGLRESPYYQGKMDIWYFFACKALDILKPNTGILTFIATNNWLTNYGASILRNKIVSDATVLQLIDFGNFKIFDSAGIQTMVLICTRNRALPAYSFDLRRITSSDSSLEDVIRLLANVPSPAASYLTPEFDRKHLKDKLLVFSDSPAEALLNKLAKQANFYLNGTKEVAQGIVAPQDSVNSASQKILGNNHSIGDGIFVLSQEEKEAIPFTARELETIKPYYTTAELQKYFGSSQNAYWVIYTDSSFKNPNKLKGFPNIKKHLDQYRAVITSDNKPYGLHRSRNEYFFQGTKIVSVRKCIEPTFTYTDFDCYVSQTFYIIKSNRINMKYLTGLLNSRVVAFWLRHKGKMQGHHFQIDKAPLLEIPLILPRAEQSTDVETLVTQILAAKAANSTANVTNLEQQIDRLVYQLYGLTPAEIALIETHATGD